MAHMIEIHSYKEFFAKMQTKGVLTGGLVALYHALHSPAGLRSHCA